MRKLQLPTVRLWMCLLSYYIGIRGQWLDTGYYPNIKMQYYWTNGDAWQVGAAENEPGSVIFPSDCYIRNDLC